MSLKNDYKDAVLNADTNTKRKYQMIDNGDNTISLVDVTDYTQVGDDFGAQDINEITGEINGHTTSLAEKVKKYSGISDGTTYVSVDSIGYDATKKKLGLKVGGADAVIPFNGALNLVHQTFSNNMNVPTIQGDFYFMNAHYGSNPALRNYRMVRSFGTYSVVQATSTAIVGGLNGDDAGYASWVIDLFHIEGDWQIDGVSILQ